ncbi:hypothetical protein D3C77_359570 [compost metagenome]
MHLVRHRSTVRIAHDKPICAGFFSFAHDRQGVFRVILVAVEEVLGIEQYLHALPLQISDRIVDHGQILFQ